MVYRHTLITRITHATFFLAFLGLVLTGTQMVLHAHWLPFKPGRIHEYLGLVMIASGVTYVASGVLSGELSKLLFGARDAAGLFPMMAYYAHLRPEPPAYDGYNPLQKLAYTIVLLTIGPLIAATGVLMWTKTGGRAMGVFHLGLAIELVLFFFGHMFMVATTGLWNNVRSMITGWYRQPAYQNAAVPEKEMSKAQSLQSSPLRRAQPTPAHR